MRWNRMWIEKVLTTKVVWRWGEIACGLTMWQRHRWFGDGMESHVDRRCGNDTDGVAVGWNRMCIDDGATIQMVWRWDGIVSGQQNLTGTIWLFDRGEAQVT